MSYTRTAWRPGVIREIVKSAAGDLSSSNVPIPNDPFYEQLAERAEELVIESIADAISAGQHDAGVIGSIRVAQHLVDQLRDELFLATEQADDPVLARLAAYLVLEGCDGYNHMSYQHAWGAQRNLDWGTIWGVNQKIRDFTPAFVFKVTLKGDVRWLAVECHAPKRTLSDDLHARVRARTTVVSGVPVISFSPVDVESDARACVHEIGFAAGILAGELLAMHGLGPAPRVEFRPPG